MWRRMGVLNKIQSFARRILQIANNPRTRYYWIARILGVLGVENYLSSTKGYDFVDPRSVVWSMNTVDSRSAIRTVDSVDTKNAIGVVNISSVSSVLDTGLT